MIPENLSALYIIFAIAAFKNINNHILNSAITGI